MNNNQRDGGSRTTSDIEGYFIVEKIHAIQFASYVCSYSQFRPGQLRDCDQKEGEVKKLRAPAKVVEGRKENKATR